MCSVTGPNGFCANGWLFYYHEIPPGGLRVAVFGAPSMGAILEVKVLPRADHSERSESQLREGDRAWGGSE